MWQMPLPFLTRLRLCRLIPATCCTSWRIRRSPLSHHTQPRRQNSVHYGIQNLELKTTTAGNNLLFVSETYYPVGWKAYLDGKEIPIYRANYLFRAVVVPAGIHKLEMNFEPKGFYFGKNLSLAANVIVLGGLGFFGFDYWRKKRKPSQPIEQVRS